MDSTEDERVERERGHLLPSPAPSPPSADARGPAAVRALLAPRIAAVYHEASAPWPDDDVERVHDVRVASRRLRAALAVVRPLLGRRASESATERVEALGDALGPRRAADVSLAWVHEARRGTTEPDELAALAQLEHLLEIRRRRASARLHRAHPPASLVDDGIALLALSERAEEAGPPLAEGIEAELARRSEAVARGLPSMTEAADDEGHHGLRIALKRLRYTCEIAGEVWPERVPASAVAALKVMQEMLGALHDDVELIALVDGPRVRRRAPGAGVDAIVARLVASRAASLRAAQATVEAHAARLLDGLRPSAATP